MRAVRLPYYRINPRYEPVISDGVTELRVHGVNGASPEQMLHDPHPLFITGDNAAAFYRRRPELDAEASEAVSGNGGAEPSVTVEAYSWNGLNSRSSTRAFWLLLFPFALTNFAAWLLPRDWSQNKRRYARSLVRLIGLSLTVEAVLVTAIIGMDLIGFQCGTSATCRSIGWLGWFEAIHVRTGSLVRTVLLMAAVPLLVMLGLWIAGLRTSIRYDRFWRGGGLVTAMSVEAGKMQPTLVDEVPLRSPAFWQAPEPVAAQALLHIAAATGALGLATGLGVAHLTGADPAWWALTVHSLVLVAAAGTLAGFGWWYRAAGGSAERTIHWIARIALGLALVAFAGDAASNWNASLAESAMAPPLTGPREVVQGVLFVQLLLVTLITGLFPRILIGAAVTGVAGIAVFNLEPSWSWWPPLLVGAAVLGTLWKAYPSLTRRGARHNTYWIVAGLAGATVAALMSAVSRSANGWTRAAAVAFLITWLVLALERQIRAQHDRPPSWELRDGSPAVMTGIACVVAAVISASGTIFVAERMGPARPAAPGEHLRGAFVYPLEFEWIAALAFAGLIVFLVALGIRSACLWYFRWKPLVEEVSATFETSDNDPSIVDITNPDEQVTFASRATRARWLAGIVDDADWLLFAAMGAMLASAYALAWTMWVGGTVGDLTGFVEFAASGLTLVALGSVWLVQRTRTDEGVRKLTGILWEVISFFPRRFHPLAPPCYAERSVPELRSRLIELTEAGDGALVLAHSEGTLISTAALLSMLDDNRWNDRLSSGIRFITFGCMIRRLFGRAFPSHLLESDLAELKAVLERVDGGDEFPCEPADPPGWMNFARPTDFLGGRVFGDLPAPGVVSDPDRPDDIMLNDPTRRWRFRGETHDARMWRHSFDYVDPEEDPRFAEHVVAARADLANSDG